MQSSQASKGSQVLNNKHFIWSVGSSLTPNMVKNLQSSIIRHSLWQDLVSAIIEFMTCFHEFSEHESANFLTNICWLKKTNIFLVVVFSALNSWVNQNSYYIIFGQKKLVNSFSENSLKHVMSLTNIMKVDIYHVVKGHWAWTMCEWTIFIILTEN